MQVFANAALVPATFAPAWSLSVQAGAKWVCADDSTGAHPYIDVDTGEADILTGDEFVWELWNEDKITNSESATIPPWRLEEVIPKYILRGGEMYLSEDGTTGLMQLKHPLRPGASRLILLLSMVNDGPPIAMQGWEEWATP